LSDAIFKCKVIHFRCSCGSREYHVTDPLSPAMRIPPHPITLLISVSFCSVYYCDLWLCFIQYDSASCNSFAEVGSTTGVSFVWVCWLFLFVRYFFLTRWINRSTYLVTRIRFLQLKKFKRKEFFWGLVYAITPWEPYHTPTPLAILLQVTSRTLDRTSICHWVVERVFLAKHHQRRMTLRERVSTHLALTCSASWRLGRTRTVWTLSLGLGFTRGQYGCQKRR
jgi:hypothetical protein